MLDSEFWDWLTIGAVGLGLIGALVFVTRFQIEVGWRGWWRSPFGRFLMIRKTLLACLFTIVLLNRMVGDWPGRLVITALLMLAFAIQTFTPYRLLMRVQREQGKNDRDETIDA